MAKRSRLPLIIIGGIILLVIIVAAVFLLNPSSQPVKIQVPVITLPPTGSVAPPAPQAPSCTIAINGQKVPPSSIELSVMANNCFAGDITELRVSVNGVQKGMLDVSPGANGIFAGTLGTNSVTVVAKFANGAEKIVYMGTIA
jgi:hypothetical protein